MEGRWHRTGAVLEVRGAAACLGRVMGCHLPATTCTMLGLSPADSSDKLVGVWGDCLDDFKLARGRAGPGDRSNLVAAALDASDLWTVDLSAGPSGESGHCPRGVGGSDARAFGDCLDNLMLAGSWGSDARAFGDRGIKEAFCCAPGLEAPSPGLQLLSILGVGDPQFKSRSIADAVQSPRVKFIV